jgi:hypothetical protein
MRVINRATARVAPDSGGAGPVAGSPSGGVAMPAGGDDDCCATVAGTPGIATSSGSSGAAPAGRPSPSSVARSTTGCCSPDGRCTDGAAGAGRPSGILRRRRSGAASRGTSVRGPRSGVGGGAAGSLRGAVEALTPLAGGSVARGATAGPRSSGSSTAIGCSIVKRGVTRLAGSSGRRSDSRARGAVTVRGSAIRRAVRAPRLTISMPSVKPLCHMLRVDVAGERARRAIRSCASPNQSRSAIERRGGRCCVIVRI